MNASSFGKDARGEAREVRAQWNMAEISWVPKEEERSIRRSRRLQGLTPDNTATMNNRSEATTQVSPLFCQNVVRNPSMFSGEISEDPQAWLKGYERVARHNHWDDSLSLANVYFYLHGTAQRWYENNEENIPSWEIFKDQLGSVFGKKDNLRRQAEQKLKVRAQTRGETTEFYIQDVLRLCREVDAQMPEEERLSHLMKGVAEEVYRYLLPRDIATTDQFIAECRRVVALQGRRVTDSKFERLPNVTSLGDLGDVTDLQSLIRQIVREEVQRALAPPREDPRISSLEEIVKEEVDKVLAPMSGINTFPMESAARSAPRNYRKNTWYAPKTRKFPWSQCYKTSQPVSSAFTIGKLRAAPSNGGEAAAQPIIPPLSTVVKMTNNYIDIKVEGDTIRALVDSGASYSVISERFRVELKKTMFAETDVVLKVADDKVVKSKGRCTLKLEVNGHPENFEFVVLENCSHDVILGWDFFKATNAVIDCGLGELQLDDLPDLDAEGRDDGVYAIQDFVIPGRSSQRISVLNRSLVGIVNMEVTCSKELFIRKDVIFPSSLIEFEEGIGKIWITNGGLQPQMIPKGMNLGRMCDIETEHVCLLSVEPESFSRERREDDHSDYLLSLINPDLPKKKKEDLMGLLLSFKGVFLPTMKNANKVQNRVKHRIHTGDHPPIKQRPYRVSKREREIMQKEVDTMLERKVIQPSESPWSAPVVLVKKKDGTWRFCVDFRRLNQITKKDVYPLPRIDDVLDHLSSAHPFQMTMHSYFTALPPGCRQRPRCPSYCSLRSPAVGQDLCRASSGAHGRRPSGCVSSGSHAGNGLYEFMVMPFGLCNAPATFERMMDNVLMGLKWNICLCYLDDIVVYSDTFEEHLERLSKVLSCLQQAGLTINPDKCLFGSTRIKILGHVVDKDGIQPDSEKVEAIKKFPVPKSVCDIQSYLGLCSYYRRFIKNFSKIAAPLQILLKKDQKFIWTQEQKDSFESLKKALMQKPVLGHFKESAITKLHTDASSYGLGAVLVQIQENQENPIAYASRTLSKAEKNYSTTERECLAVIWAIGKFRPYLYGRPFEVVSDHHSLCWLAGLKDPSGRLARWALKLQDFDATITYKSGVKHKDADCLSRYPLPESPALTSLTLVREQQNLDPDITKISNALNQGEGAERFEMKNGLLYKRNFDPLGRRLLLVIPKRMRPDILKEFHDVPTAGHLGFARTYDRIRKRYFWPGLYNSVRRYVAHCKECQRRKGENKLPAGKLIPIKPPSFPFQKIGMDLLGRFPLSDKGNRWIIVCTDYLTKYAIAKALPSGTAAEIATFILEEVILKHGAPREIITDRGRAFMSQMVKEVTSRCKISHLFTTAYHPQTNGLTERLNKTLGDMLSMYVDAEQRDWDSVLPYVIFAYNTAQQGSTRFSPFFLVHGREAETLLDVLLPYEDETSDHDFGDQMVTKAEEARQLARIHILRAQENNKYHYDQVHRSVEYRVGDLVWVFTPVRKTGLSEKLLKKYFGPYKITRKVSEVNYEVEALEQSSRRRRRSQKDVVHVLRMKPYRDPGQQLVTGDYNSWDSEDAVDILEGELIQGLNPLEYSKMQHEGRETPQGEYHFKHIRNPSIFSGEPGQSPEKWLKEYHRVARYNCWDSSMCLANVYFFLSGTAKVWFENVEEKITSWEIFETMLSQAFGHYSSEKDQLLEKLKARAQGKEESSEAYIQDVLYLCRQINPNMNENEKVAHLVKGVSEEIYRAIVTFEIATTEEFIRWCRKIELSQKKRVNTRIVFDRLPNAAAINPAESESMEDLIRRIVREEIHHALNPEPATLKPSSLDLIIREEVERNLSAISQPIPLKTKRNAVALSPIQSISSPPKPGKLRRATETGGKAADESINPPPIITANMKRNYVVIIINGQNVEALVDSGADYSVISENFRRYLKIPFFAEKGPVLRVANRKHIETLGRCNLKVSIEELEIYFTFVVFSECSHHIILGLDFFRATSAVIDCGKGEIHLKESVNDGLEEDLPTHALEDCFIPARSIKKITVINEDIRGGKDLMIEGSKDLILKKELVIPSSIINFHHGRGEIWVTNGTSQNQIIPAGMLVGYLRKIGSSGIYSVDTAEDDKTQSNIKSEDRRQQILSLVDERLDKEQKSMIVECLEKYSEVFDFERKSFSTTSNVKHKIDTSDSRPIKQRPYRVSPVERRAIQSEVDKMIKMGIVQPSESPWSSPVVLVKKKDGSWRFCVDYRKLNKVTKKDVYPLPRNDDVLDSLTGAKFFSSMDLRTGYWQIEIDEEDREKTAFITPDGLYEFRVMPFGLCNAPATFERMMDKLLAGLKWTICLCYLDDIIVYATSFKEHIERLGKVLRCIQQAGLCINHEKCRFGSREIKVLGHLVTESGIRPDPDKIEAITNFPTPKTAHEVRSFMGLCSYYRRFVKDFANKAKPLHDLLRNNVKFFWSNEQEQSFQILKSALTTDPVLGHFKEDAETLVHTDASGYGVGAVLTQLVEGKEKPIAYASRTLNAAERNYSTTERECLAVVWAIYKFRPYLFGKHFTVVSDHHSLCWLANVKDPSGRLARWALRLQEFDISIVYKNGKRHQDADCLSRSPLPQSNEDNIPELSSITDIGKEQRSDVQTKKIIQEIDSKSESGYKIIDGILYRKNYDPMGKPWLLVVPKQMRVDILSEAHDAPMAGHLGFAKTYDRIRRKYFWPGLHRSVRQYVAHCRECQRRKGSTERPPGQLVPIPPVARPFQKIGIDLLGRFPTSNDGNKWTVVATDYLTRYAMTKAIPNGSSEEVGKFLVEDVILKHGAPRELISDRGRTFISHTIREINNLCGTAHRFTSAYHPQTNGLTERLNKTLGDMLSMYVDVDQRNWDSVLPYVTFAYNTAKQETTGFSPFYLVHGRDVETPLDTILTYREEANLEVYVESLVTNAEDARQLARLNILKAQEKDKSRYDKSHRPVQYCAEDLVWVYTPVRKQGLSEKLLKRYFGPYKVVRQLSEVTYEVEALERRPRQRNIKDIVHVLRMKPYRSPEEQTQD
ncbi:hypothetical protein LAZ67_X001057 [Cordylochernes scorpioides]|uniref:RNA-directed DNA polymerase n=1 Tax=Cordylochernes scorpioides TaxID=51811 RepID=A0ABY6LT79_9ARAC|nr:hypothetical protein LAZ67_X001057 [Cordylochernes scorpioides]